MRRRGPRDALVACAAMVAVGVAVLLIASGGSSYRVTARFDNAGQLVKGNLVQVSGTTVGIVEEIRVSEDWRADVVLRLDEDFGPLRRGTTATIRQSSLSGVANRYVDLGLPPGDRVEAIADGGTIPVADTQGVVDFDQVFAIFGPEERRDLQRLVKGFAKYSRGAGRNTNRGLEYLNASLSSTSRLFDEIARDDEALDRFILDSSRLATDVAERRDDLAGLVEHLSVFLGALANRRADLAEAFQRLPDFMRRANSTFVNLRAVVDDLDPLLQESLPAARRLGPVLAELRGFAADARPTVADLSAVLERPGADNDLVDLTRSNVPVRDALVSSSQRNGERRLGALPSGARSLDGSSPILNFFRPYTPDLLGWFDDFSHTGIYDALGGASRASLHANAFATANGLLVPVAPEARGRLFEQVASLHQTRRCPGSAEHAAEDGSNPFKPSDDFNCDPSHELPGD